MLSAMATLIPLAITENFIYAIVCLTLVSIAFTFLIILVLIEAIKSKK